MNKTLSIIIPCKNEPDIVEMMRETEIYCPDAQIIVSSDRYGYGKGWALRQGLKEAKGELICFIDGDLDIHPAYINIMRGHMAYYDICVGRKHLHGRVDRIFITLCARLFIGLLMGLWFDTQTGIKMFRREALPNWEDNSFAFDLEILSKAKAAGAKICEIPVGVRIRKSMPSRSILRFLKGAIMIRWRQP